MGLSRRGYADANLKLTWDASLTITLPDGSQIRRRPAAGRWTSPNRSARAWPTTPWSRASTDELYDLTRPLEARRASRDPDLEESGSAGGLSPLDRAPAGGGGARTVSRRPSSASARPPTPASIYDFQRDDAVHARRPREDREQDVGDPGQRTCPTSASLTPKARGPRRSTPTERWMKCELIDGEGRRRSSPNTRWARTSSTSAAARTCRPPWTHQGLQAAVGRRRLLEGRRAQRAAAAHLRHRVLQQEGSRRVPQRSSKRPRSATTASSARNSTCSASRNWPARA